MAADKMTGATFFMGDVGVKKRPAPALDVGEGVTKAELDDVEQLMARQEKEGKRLAEGLRAFKGAVDRIASLGLTPDLFVVLATELAPYPRSSKNKLSQEQVRAALKGFFQIGEYLG